MNSLAFLNSNSNAKYLLNNANNNNSNTNNTIKNEHTPTLFNDESTFDDSQLKQLLQLKQHEKLMQHINNSQQEDLAYHHNQNQLIDLNNNNFDSLNLNALKSLSESSPQFINNLQYASNKNDKKIFDLLNRLNLNQNPKQAPQINLHDLQQQQHQNMNHNFDSNYSNNDNANANLLNMKLKYLQQQQLLQLQNLQHNTNNNQSNLQPYQLANESLSSLNKLATINNIKSLNLNGFIDKDNEDMLDNKYRQASANQQDLIRKLLEKKKQQELNIINYQQQKQFQQLQSKILSQQYQQQQQVQQQLQLQQQQQQNYEPV